MTSERVTVYVGVGSNIEPEKNIEGALKLLKARFSHLRQSKRYQTRAVGFSGDDFINMVVAFDAADGLAQVLRTLHSIEQDCGRNRVIEQGKGSRTLDLDLLLFGELEGEHQGCVLPRPEIFERQFVWQPLLELLPDSGYPASYTGVKKQIMQLAHKVPWLESIT